MGVGVGARGRRGPRRQDDDEGAEAAAADLGTKKRADFGRFTAAQLVELDGEEEGGRGDRSRRRLRWRRWHGSTARQPGGDAGSGSGSLTASSALAAAPPSLCPGSVARTGEEGVVFIPRVL